MVDKIEQVTGQINTPIQNDAVIHGHIKSYVLRQARLTNAQNRAFTEYGSRFILPWQNSPINYAEIFGNDFPIVLEIGFGMGHATAEIAHTNPHINYLAVEVHTP